MKRLLAWMLALIILLPVLAFGENATKVVDDAGLLSESEKTTLQAQITEIIAQYDNTIDLVVCTTRDTGGKSTQAYADDYYDQNGYGVDSRASGVLLLINMDIRELGVSTLGLAVDGINDNEVAQILDAMYAHMGHQEDYSAALAGGLTAVADALRTTTQSTSQQSGAENPALSPMTLVIALVVGLLAGGGAVLGVQSSYNARKAPDNYPLGQNANLDLTRRLDVFAHRHVSRIKIERSSSSGGGGGSTHKSSSGRSHGGGTRRF